MIKTDVKLSDYIVNLTGITNEMIQNALKFEIVMSNFQQSLNMWPGTVVIAHNVLFDIPFINFWLEKNKMKNFLNGCKTICSLDLARRKLPNESHKLENLKNKLGIKTTSHRALNDALVTKKIYERLMKL